MDDSTRGGSARRREARRTGAALRALGLALALLPACSRKNQNVPAPVTGTGGSGGQATPADFAAATPENPLRPAAERGLMPTRNGPSAPSGQAPKLDSLQLPPGFTAALYADVPNARSLARGAKGTVFVSSRKDDKVYALVDSDGDYKLDQRYVVAQSLDTPNGIAYQNGSLYIAEIERLLRLDGIDERLENPPDPVVVTDKLPSEKHHGWRYIRFGPDGWLYMPIGAPCNVCKREEPIYASVARLKGDGSSGLEVFAHGVRNSVGFDWHPETKELWFTENGRDELGDDLPPDELDRAYKPGLHFGFPYCHAGAILDPQYGEGHSCTEFEPPVQALAPHAAALGMRFYTGKMFPAEYGNAVFIAEHGSWNRAKKSGYRVTVVRLEGNRARSYEAFASGWLDEAADEVWGRPVDVEVLDDGSLLVSDDYQGAVYRIAYKR